MDFDLFMRTADQAVDRSNTNLTDALEQEIEFVKTNRLIETIGTLQGDLLFIKHMAEAEKQKNKLRKILEVFTD